MVPGGWPTLSPGFGKAWGKETISYCYDSLHRMTGKAYSAQTCQNGQLPVGTAVVSFTYDQGTNGVGRTTKHTHRLKPKRPKSKQQKGKKK